VQGGLVIGTTRPGTTVTLDGRPLRVGEDGTFVFGLGRWAKARATLRLTLPDGREVTRVLQVRRRKFRVQRIDNLPQAMVTPPEELRTRILAEQSRLAALWGVDTPEPLFKSGFTWPARGVVTGVYGSQRILNGEPRQPHWGLDIAAPEGTPVVAPADGIVLAAERDFYYTGGTILLDHGFGIVSGFLHLSELSVTERQRVRQGEVIGKVGSTGRSTGPHLDWRVRWLEVFVDPRLLLPRP
jgi:murein DD-endopeptidase MepM/ murein hydrolase activator NlpD